MDTLKIKFDIEVKTEKNNQQVQRLLEYQAVAQEMNKSVKEKEEQDNG
ncbi:MAG: hypothetical protein KH230_09795 [Enterocloster asparagiformis]|nr:hypothetical protein [Enterocloster asparagiformis]